MYEKSSMTDTHSLNFVTTGSAAECQGLLNSGIFEYVDNSTDPVDTDGNTGCGSYEPCCEDCSSDCDWCGTDMSCFQECYGSCVRCCSQCYYGIRHLIHFILEHSDEFKEAIANGTIPLPY